MSKGKYVAYISSYTQGDSHGIRIYDVDMKNGRFKEKDKVEITNSSYLTISYNGKFLYYVGCDLDNDAMKELVRIIAKSANVETVDTPNGVEVVKRDDCTIILNHNENEVDTKIKGVSLFDGLEFNGVLDGYGVQFLEGSI